jgi:hypothetical protein
LGGCGGGGIFIVTGHQNLVLFLRNRINVMFMAYWAFNSPPSKTESNTVQSEPDSTLLVALFL